MSKINLDEFELFSMEELFHRIPNKTVISAATDYSDEYNRKDAINDIINTIDSNKFDTFATCKCGSLQGNFLLGKLCKCGHTVSKEDPQYLPNAWYSVEPEEGFHFMHPYFYVAFDDFFQTKKMYIMKFLTGKTVEAVPKYALLKRVLTDYQTENGIPYQRNIAFFKEHWKGYFLKVAEEPGYELLYNVVAFLEENEHLLHTTKIPLPSKRFLSMEKSKNSTFSMVKRLKRIVDIHLYAGDDKYEELDYINAEIAGLYRTIGTSNTGIISSKQGLVRHNVGSGSVNFGFRAPITLLPSELKHETDIIHLPYSIGMIVFKYHLMNKLIRQGFHISTVRARLARAVRNFDEELYNILENDIIKKAHGGRGMVCMMQRNPSQGTRGMQKVYIAHVKEDVESTTVSTCDITLEANGGDIDGRRFIK